MNSIASRVSGGSSSRSGSFSRGKMTRFRPGALRGERLLAQAADRQHLPGERDLAGHADVVRDRLVAHERRDRRRHRHAGRRAVLRHRARRHVDVHVVLGEPVVRAARARSVCERTHESAACADSCITSPSWPVIVQAPLARVRGRLDEQDVAADASCTRARSRRPGCDVRLRTSPENRRGAEPLAQLLVVDA